MDETDEETAKVKRKQNKARKDSGSEQMLKTNKKSKDESNEGSELSDGPSAEGKRKIKQLKPDASEQDPKRKNNTK